MRMYNPMLTEVRRHQTVQRRYWYLFPNPRRRHQRYIQVWSDQQRHLHSLHSLLRRHHRHQVQ